MNAYLHSNNHGTALFAALVTRLRAAGCGVFFGFAYDCLSTGVCCEPTANEQRSLSAMSAGPRDVSPPHAHFREHLHRSLLRDLLQRCDVFVAVQTDEQSRFLAGSANQVSCEIALELLQEGRGPRIVIMGSKPSESSIGLRLLARGAQVALDIEAAVTEILSEPGEPDSGSDP